MTKKSISIILLVVLFSLFHLGSSVLAEDSDNKLMGRKAELSEQTKLEATEEDRNNNSNSGEKEESEELQEKAETSEDNDFYMLYQIGDSGNHVSRLKRKLTTLGYGGFPESPTINYDSETKKVVKEFQLVNELQETGKADKNTLKLIDEFLSLSDQVSNKKESDTLGPESSNEFDPFSDESDAEMPDIETEEKAKDESKVGETGTNDDEASESTGGELKSEEVSKKIEGEINEDSDLDPVQKEFDPKETKDKSKLDEKNSYSEESQEATEEKKSVKKKNEKKTDKKPILLSVQKNFILKKGTRDSRVIELKKDLGKLSYGGITITNYYGAFTEKRVKQFQKYYGLKVTGEADNVTLSKIESLLPNPLSKGKRHKDTIALKKSLNNLGYGGITVTSYFGSFTEKRVKQFQKYYGLKVTGEANQTTLSKIDSLLPNPLSKGKRHKDTIALKKDLNNLGYGGITVTNYYGAFTERRVKEFQKDHGLSITGIADTKTLVAINKAMESGEKIDYTKYDLTLSGALAIQLTATPQTDLYKQYVSSNWIGFDGADYYVTADVLNVRGGPGTNYSVVDTFYKGQKVSVRGKEGDWYRLFWVDAKKADIKYYLNPNNFINDEKQRFQFLDLSRSSNASKTVLNNYLIGKGTLTGQGQAFIDASRLNGFNDVYLISHAILETGNGSSTLARGVKYKGKTVYNMYGIGAYDSCALECGAKRAYEEGWTTPYKAIVGGAKFIGDSYIKSGQNTIYKMRWNPEAMAATGRYGKQYATDIGWASKQINTMYNLYQQLDSYSLYLEVPEYK